MSDENNSARREVVERLNEKYRESFKQITMGDYRYWFVKGVKEENERLLKRIKDQVCFDALADSDGRCENHGGKCYELLQLIQKEEME
jgi:hypothetical protein